MWGLGGGAILKEKFILYSDPAGSLETALHYTAQHRPLVTFCMYRVHFLYKMELNSKLPPVRVPEEIKNTHTYTILLIIFRMRILRNRLLRFWVALFSPFMLT